MTTTREPARHATRSRDGTEIAWWTSGTGPDLLLVHGTSADHTRWAQMAPLLEPHVTVHAMDRRGRGDSGDAADYSLDAEGEDVAAVVEALGGPVDVFGHSHGGVCALEASRRTTAVRRMVLYEPAIGVAAPEELRQRVRALVESGRRDEAVASFLAEVAGLDAGQLAATRALPSWSGRVAAAHTIVREEEAAAAYRFDPDRFAEITVPTLLLDGTVSPPELRRATALVAGALPVADVVRLEGHGHVAMLGDPGLVVRATLAFLQA